MFFLWDIVRAREKAVFACVPKGEYLREQKIKESFLAFLKAPTFPDVPSPANWMALGAKNQHLHAYFISPSFQENVGTQRKRESRCIVAKVRTELWLSKTTYVFQRNFNSEAFFPYKVRK